jgi:hypothetical protein
MTSDKPTRALTGSELTNFMITYILGQIDYVGLCARVVKRLPRQTIIDLIIVWRGVPPSFHERSIRLHAQHATTSLLRSLIIGIICEQATPELGTIQTLVDVLPTTSNRDNLQQHILENSQTVQDMVHDSLVDTLVAFLGPQHAIDDDVLIQHLQDLPTETLRETLMYYIRENRPAHIPGAVGQILQQLRALAASRYNAGKQ